MTILPLFALSTNLRRWIAVTLVVMLAIGSVVPAVLADDSGTPSAVVPTETSTEIPVVDPLPVEESLPSGNEPDESLVNEDDGSDDQIPTVDETTEEDLDEPSLTDDVDESIGTNDGSDDLSQPEDIADESVVTDDEVINDSLPPDGSDSDSTETEDTNDNPEVKDDSPVDIVEVPSEVVDGEKDPTDTEDDNLDEVSPTVTETPTVEPTGSVVDDASPTATETPTSTPTEVPTDEATPTQEIVDEVIPVTISWSKPNPITCEVIGGDPGSLNLNDTATWRCQATISTSITGELPDDLAIIWALQADYAGDLVSFQLPQGSVAEVLPADTVPDGINARMRLRLPYADANEQLVAFDVVVTRSSCTVGESPLKLTSEPTFDVDDVTVTRTDKPADEPFKLVTTAAPNGEPAISFDGPITFEGLSATSAGLESPVSRGSGTIVVAGAWNPCTDYTLYLSGSMQLPESTSATLRVVAINDESIPGGACDLTSDCALVALPEVGDAATPLRYTVQLEVEFDTFMLPGDYGMTVTVGTEAVQANP